MQSFLIPLDVPCETNIFLEVGKQGVVSCSFQDFELVGWINGNGSPGEATPFIYLENSEKKGKGYKSGHYDIFPNGSLIINRVGLKHEFNFTVVYSPRVGKQLSFIVPVKVFGKYHIILFSCNSQDQKYCLCSLTQCLNTFN